MRGDCRSNDTVSRFTGKFFTGRLLEILNICAANSANCESGDDNLWREIRSSPDRRRYVVTHLAWSRSDKKRIERQQKLTAAQINRSRPFTDTEDRLFTETRDRLILKRQLTPGLDTGLHRRPLANIIVHCSRTR